jgi:hypothetical protein
MTFYRHPSEGWGPYRASTHPACAGFSMGPSLRWGDGRGPWT